MNKGFITEIEIHVVSLQRSGSHAMINWMMSQLKGAGIFLNNIAPGDDPFCSAAQREVVLPSGTGFSTRVKAMMLGGRSKWMMRRILGTARGEKSWEKMTKTVFPRIKKDYLIYSHEDRSLKEIFTSQEEAARGERFGRSIKKHRVLILRDVFNFLASRVRWRELCREKGERLEVFDAEVTEKWVFLWKEYAKEYLGQTGYIGDKGVVINFNNWVSDREYRRMIAQRLGLTFSDSGINSIPRYGKGSTFDGYRYDGKASKMRVRQRWQYYSNNKAYNDMFRDKELVELSREIFGDIKGIAGNIG